MKQHLTTLLVGFVALAAMPGTFVIAGIIMSMVELLDLKFYIIFLVSLFGASYTLGYIIKRLKQ